MNEQKDLSTIKSVSLKAGLLDEIDKLTTEYKLTRNALMRFAVVWYLAHPPADINDLLQSLDGYAGNLHPRGIALKSSEFALLEELAGKHGIKSNKLMNLAFINLLQDIKSGTLDMDMFIETVITKNLKFPEI